MGYAQACAPKPGARPDCRTAGVRTVREQGVRLSGGASPRPPSALHTSVLRGGSAPGAARPVCWAPEATAVYSASPLVHLGVSVLAHALEGKGVPEPPALPQLWGPRGIESQCFKYLPATGRWLQPTSVRAEISFTRRGRPRISAPALCQAVGHSHTPGLPVPMPHTPEATRIPDL